MAWHGITYTLNTPLYTAKFPMLFTDLTSLDTGLVEIAGADFSGLISAMKQDGAISDLCALLGKQILTSRPASTIWHSLLPELIGVEDNSIFNTAQAATTDIDNGVSIVNTLITNNEYGFQFDDYLYSNTTAYPRYSIYSNSNANVVISIPIYSANIIGGNGKIDPDLVVAGQFMSGSLVLQINGGTTPFYHVFIANYGISNYEPLANSLRLFAGKDIVVIEPTDPYLPAGDSESGSYPSETVGGDGTFDFDSDLIPDSSTPTNPFAGGMIMGYMLTDAQMRQLAQFLWASPWDWLAQWRKLWGDPMNAIIGCFIVNLPAYSGSSATVKLGNIDTGISALAVNGVTTVNCGTVFIDKKYGSYLDYSPYTSLELYLPYIGTVGLNVDEVMGKYITVSYNVCLLDGSATCTVFVGDGTNLSVLHQYSCMVGMNVPVTSAQYDGMQRSLSNVIGAVTDNIVPAITTIAGMAAGMLNPAIAAGALGGMASNIMGSEENNPVTLNKPNIRHSGGISMASGLMGRQRPYIIRHTPRMAFPEGQNTYIGYPNWTGMSLGSLSGFTRVHKIHLSCSGTEEEKAEIVRLLMEGVIL